MKNNKLKAKEGMTLIEVIISVALLSILIVHLSSLVMSSLKNNISTEYRQKASYVGQKVLEELKSYDEIKLSISSPKYFELLDGDRITQNSEGKFVGSFDRTIYGGIAESIGKNEDIYNVEVKLEKDSTFQYHSVNNLDKNNDAAFRVSFINDNNISKIQDSAGNTQIISNNLTIELDKNSDNLKVYEKNSSSPLLTINRSKLNNTNIVLNVKENFTQNIDIELKNNTEETLGIYIIRETNNSSKFRIYSSTGDVILYEEKKTEENPVADMYNYIVTVRDKKNNILFEGSSSKNMNIK